MQKPPAVVIGLDSMQGLQAARILARHDVPVFGMAARKSAHCRTNVCKEILMGSTASEELIANLLTLGRRLTAKGVLFPCEDNSVLLVSRNRRELDKYFHVLLPAEDVVEMLMDKVSFYTYAQQNGLAIPPTYFVESTAALNDLNGRLTYPCVIKPRDSAAKRWENETVLKAFKVFGTEELVGVYQRFKRWTDCFIVQEWIEGDDSDLYSCNCYFDANSKPLATFVARKLRQWPPQTGVSCLGEEIRNDAVLEETLRLFGNVNYRGLGYLEMKRDRRTGRHYIVEPNIGRPTGRSAIAEAGGVELLHTAYCDAVGLPLPEQREQKYQGVKWVHLRKDLQSSFHYWRRGELSIGQWWRSLRGRKAYALESWRDPLPCLGDWVAAAVSALSPRKRRKRQGITT